MTKAIASIAAAFAVAASALAGRLDIAVIQFSDERDPAELAAALSRTKLLDITNSDRVESRDPALRNGTVVFVQSLFTSPGSRFAATTRIGNRSADTSGVLSGSNINVDITIQEGVDSGIRKFTRSAYSGSGDLSGGRPEIIGFKKSSGRTQTATKGSSRIVSFSYSSVIVAQYTP